MEADNLVGEVRVETHAWCETNGHVGEEPKEKRAEAGYGRGCGDEVTVQILLEDEVLGVRQTYRVCCIVAYAVASSVGKNSGIDCYDVCHCEEGRKSCPHFGSELRM